MPYNVLDLKYGLKPQATAPTNHEIAEGVLQQTQEILNQSQQALMQAYVRHKRYYDRKASAHPLVVNDYCYALHPKAHSQATKLPFREYLWTGPYIVVKTLPNNNYLIRKLQTNFTQILHRIRLRSFASSHKLPDITVPPKDFQQDTKVAIQHDDLFAMAWKELYKECPNQPENKQLPEPEVIQPTPETINDPTHPGPPSPNLVYDPEIIPNHPSDQTQNPLIDIVDEPENNTPAPQSSPEIQLQPSKKPDVKLETRLCLLQCPNSQFNKLGIFFRRTGQRPRITGFTGPRPRRQSEVRKLIRPRHWPGPQSYDLTSNLFKLQWLSLTLLYSTTWMKTIQRQILNPQTHKDHGAASSFNFSSNFSSLPYSNIESKLKNTSETKNGTIEHSIKKNSQQYTQGR